MKKLLFVLVTILLAVNAKGQIGVSYLHSDMISTLGTSYQVKEKLNAELRIGMSVQNFVPHVQLNYSLLNKKDFNLYVASAYSYRYGVITEISTNNISVTVGSQQSGTFLTGIGFNVSPFSDMKNFSFVAEGLFGASSLDSFLQGSIGFRYTFLKEAK
ncbi:MAG: hypothetical protein ACJAVN_001018 [Roseivirga sp.]|jgi:hypothetical protein